MATLQVSAKEVSAGMRGAAYLNGQRWAECKKWRCYRSVNRSKELVIGQGQEQSVEQSFSYHLTVSKLQILDTVPAAILAADATGDDVEFRFIGERKTGDGRISRVVIDGCVIGGDMDIQNLEQGKSSEDDLTFDVNGTPSFDATIS